MKVNLKHLKLRGNIWWYQRRVPKHLADYYPDQKFIQQSLETGDVRLAKKKRDVLNGKLEFKSLSVSSGIETISLSPSSNISHMTHTKNSVNTFKQSAIDSDELEGKLTFAVAVKMWKEGWGKDKTTDTLQKVDRSVVDFGRFCFKTFDWANKIDIALHQITKKDVYAYIQQLEKTYKRATVQAKISRLKVVWDFADTMGHVTGTNPFTGHKYSSAEELQTDKREVFTEQEMKLIRAYKWEKPVYGRAIVKSGVWKITRHSAADLAPRVLHP